MKDAHPENSRLQWVDLFRGAAVLWMIETHVTNTFLRQEILRADWFAGINYANGLVAPAFLFIAGLLQGVLTRPGLPPVGFWRKRLSRIGQLLLIAYALHLSNPFTTGWTHPFSQIDVLQCIAISLLLGLLLQRWLGVVGVSLGACFFVFAAPPMSLVPPNQLPALLAGYVNRQNGSLFPLFPWAGFFLAGWACNRLKPRGCLIAAGCCWAGVWLQRFAPSFYPAHDYYLAGPGFFFERVGWMLSGAGLCQVIAARWAPKWVLNAGGNSLAIYVIHLQVINLFVSAAGALGLAQRVGLLGAAALLAAVAACTLTLTGLLGLPRVAPACRWLGVRPASA